MTNIDVLDEVNLDDLFGSGENGDSLFDGFDETALVEECGDIFNMIDATDPHAPLASTQDPLINTNTITGTGADGGTGGVAGELVAVAESVELKPPKKKKKGRRSSSTDAAVPYPQCVLEGYAAT
eukprot:CAMPEP_0194416770 /NCGR_PEP_ID=MMETSP0176-20130528/15728_1 /TAXON_ID=216777 /ORGANISM="Proboscia alata, Strain PI-D3" /LENGTH=124 /DNA_ID=CAMNT_0039222239 /DNA_START=2 /DNA_END=372 /DNA_ORIENTATION=-